MSDRSEPETRSAMLRSSQGAIPVTFERLKDGRVRARCGLVAIEAIIERDWYEAHLRIARVLACALADLRLPLIRRDYRIRRRSAPLYGQFGVQHDGETAGKTA